MQRIHREEVRLTGSGRFLLCCLDWQWLHLGVTLFLLSDLGTDTFTVFIQGLSRTVHLSVGTVHAIVLCILMVVMLMTTKGYVKPGTVVCAFLGGPIIDLFTWMLGAWINADAGMPIRIGSMLVGCVVLALGMSIVINSNAGTGPNDLIAIILSDKIPAVEFRWVRVGCDLFLFFSAVSSAELSGLDDRCSILTGPPVQFWLPKTKRSCQNSLQINGRNKTDVFKNTSKPLFLIRKTDII